MVVKVGETRQLQAAVLAFAAADKGLRKRINDSTRATFNQPWKAGITSRARTGLERRVLVPGARIAAGNPPVFVAASSRRALRGGLVPDSQWPAAEFGADRAKKTTYQRRSTRGHSYPVTRRTRRQLPSRRDTGPVFDTLADIAHRAPRLWAQLIVKVYSDAAEGR